MPAESAEVLLVFTNLPDEAAAQGLAQHLVESRLAACVNVLTPCQSIYRWEGAVKQASEVPLIIKTTVQRYPELEAVLRARHPYELPEIIAVPLARALPAYLDWVAAATA